MCYRCIYDLHTPMTSYAKNVNTTHYLSINAIRHSNHGSDYSAAAATHVAYNAIRQRAKPAPATSSQKAGGCTVDPSPLPIVPEPRAGVHSTARGDFQTASGVKSTVGPSTLFSSHLHSFINSTHLQFTMGIGWILKPLAVASAVAFSTLGVLSRSSQRARLYFNATIFIATLGAASAWGVVISVLASVTGQVSFHLFPKS